MLRRDLAAPSARCAQGGRVDVVTGANSGIGFEAARVCARERAHTILACRRAATDPQVMSGEYYGPDGFRQTRGYPVRVESSPACRDPDTARRLWVVSEELTGVRFPI